MKPLFKTLWDEPLFTSFRTSTVNSLEQHADDMLRKAFPELYKELGVNLVGSDAYPRVDIVEHADKVTLEADIHGLRKEDVSVDVTGDMLVISGNKRDKPADQNATYIRREIKRSSFRRAFQLGEKIAKDKIEAKFENGSLIINLPKIVEKVPETPKSTVIPIK